MAISRQEFEKKFVKMTELEVINAEDESSVDSEGNQIEVKKLTLREPIEVTGSIPLADGTKIKLTENVVYVANDAYDQFLADSDIVEDNGVEITKYSGTMKLDVAKPKGRMRNGKYEITKAARIWLTPVSYNKMGSTMRANNLNAQRDALTAWAKGVKETEGVAGA